MDEWVARFLMVVEGVGIVCITALTAYWMKLRHQRKLLADQNAVAQLEQRLEELRGSTEAEIAELAERVDFSERLLAKQRDALSEPSPSPTPV